MKNKIAFALLFTSVFCLAQHSGNEVYRTNRNKSDNYFSQNDIAQSKSSANISQSVYKINILNNVVADSYRVTFGLNQEGLTPKECNAKINVRILEFKKALAKLGVRETEIFVDFISQTKIYDYDSKVSGSVVSATQKAVGFEMKKNVILKFADLSLFDALVSAASEFEIHNVVKIDYTKSDTQKIYDEMFAEAKKLLEQRKKLDEKLSDPETQKNPQVSVRFYAVQPGDQYQTYKAFESTDVQYEAEYYRQDKSLLRKEQRKSSTFYFDGQKPDFFDKTLNADTPVVGLQYVMQFEIVYARKVPEIKNEYQIITPNGEVRKVKLD
ncbi:SIMPL domain-containing protein [Flavobacterium sp.]|uniref:SIMPL domain-containing protein n=1 Tax=Flavobacterium sp. TaxID=239 RepID=UPI0025BF5D72|nr:SIMPL domain-containing protein [Flavobacterium sp.]